MERGWLCVVLSFALGCSDEAPPTESKAIAMLQKGAAGDLQIAVTSEENLAALPAILTDAPPQSFRWIRLTVGASKVAAIYAPQGYTGDLTQSQAEITVLQTFPDACNPNTNDFSTCWFVEKLVAGESGVSGRVSIAGSLDKVSASLDVLFEGQSTRHGAPAYFKHQTVSAFDASIVAGGAQ